ncbi:protein peste-like [Ochlerotatus camptorhynchus]|uniref:protein peste-like n=1 Tax=Ochlerotatus camptorhynchus TaxID=644619 RepID=UPI0031D1E8EC
MRIDRFCCAATVGASLAVVGAIFALFWGDILDAIIVKEKLLTPTSRTFKLWRRPPVPIQWSITLFNWTNAKAYLANEATRPSFTEIGPFLYSENLEKVDARFNTKNATISYRRRSYFTPDELLDDNLLDQSVTNVNVVALAAANRGYSRGNAYERTISFALYSFKQRVVVTKRASELLFDGYPEPFIKKAKEVFQSSSDGELEDRFSWFRSINGSKKFHGYFNMDSGKEDSSRYGLVHTWNYRDRVNSSRGECGKYDGFTEELFPTKIRKDHRLRLFLMELCRVVSFGFEREEVIHGVMGYRFVGEARSVDDQCSDDKEHLPSGVINITECKLGAPHYASFPHFFLADGYYRGGIDGMNKDEERHQSFFTIEPKTGTVLKSSLRLQINALLQQYSGVALYQDAPQSYLPILWFARSFHLPEEEVLKLKGLLDVSQLGYVGAFAVAGLGLLIVLLAIGLRCAVRSTQRKSMAGAALANGDARGDYEFVQNEQNKDKDRIKL